MPAAAPLRLRWSSWPETAASRSRGSAEADRQLGQHGGHPVAQLAVLVGEPQRHRHQRPEEVVLDRLASAGQVPAESSRDRGQHHVVDRAARGVLHRLHLGQVAPRPGPAPVRAQRAVQDARRVGGGPADLADSVRAGGGGAGALDRRPRAAHEGATDLDGDPRGPRGARADQGAAGGRRGRPPRGGGWRRRLGIQVQHELQDVVAGDAVDHRVVHLRQHGPAPPGQPLDEPHLPQRPVAVEALPHHPPAQGPELGLVSGPGDGGVPQVVGEREVRVVDPQRTGHAQRHRLDPLAVARERVEPGLDVGAERRRSPAPGRRRPSASPTCICWVSFSICRKAQSSALSRSATVDAPPGGSCVPACAILRPSVARSPKFACRAPPPDVRGAYCHAACERAARPGRPSGD